MKNLFAMTAALMMGFGATASNVELVVEAVDNNGTVPGNTYRVYAVCLLPNTLCTLCSLRRTTC